MACRRLILWAVLVFLFVVTISPFGLWAAARTWPETVGPYIPLRIAMSMATWGEQEQEAAAWSLSSYDSAIPGQRDYAAQILAEELKATPERQRRMLFLLDQMEFGPSNFFRGACEAEVYRLTQSADDETRRSARRVWLGPDAYRRMLHRLFSGSLDHQGVASPDGWIPSEVVFHAVALQARMWAGFDHKTPNKYKRYCEDRIQFLVTAMAAETWAAEDLRTKLVCLGVVAELQAMTADQSLLPIIQKELAIWQSPELHQFASSAWMQDSTTAYLMADCGRAMMNGHANQVIEVVAKLRSSFDLWAATGAGNQPPTWRHGGIDISAPEGERWAMYFCGAWLMNQYVRFPTDPPEALVNMTSWSPLGGHLSAMALGIGHRGGPFARSTWRDAYTQRLEMVTTKQVLTRDHLGFEGGWLAHPNYGDAWESLFVSMQYGYRF